MNDYNTVEVAFYKKTAKKATIYDKIVAWWTGGDYCHTEIIINGFQYSSSPRDGGVRVKQHYRDSETWDYVKISSSDIDIRKGIKFFHKTKHCKYDWRGIFGFISPISDREDRYFCSEWCSKFLMISGVEEMFDKNPSKISPMRLYNILTHTKYEGNIIKRTINRIFKKGN